MLLLFSPQYLVYTILGIVMLPALIFSMIAEGKVKHTYSKYGKIPTQAGRSAYELARAILDRAGLGDVGIVQSKGRLNCYYDHAKRTLALSEDVIHSSSVAAIGVAAHEAGHALQYATNYRPVFARKALGRVMQITNTLMWPLLLAASLLSYFATSIYVAGMPIGKFLIICTIVVFGISILFSLITLPVEYNASRRAKNILAASGAYSPEEIQGASKVLNAAALTYVAALLTSIASMLRILLYLLVLFGGRRKR